MRREKLLFDPKGGGWAKRVIASDAPEGFRAASGKVGQRILEELSSGPKYPAEVARTLRVHQQTVYYHFRTLEKAGLIRRVSNATIRGGEAKVFSLTADGYAVEFPVKGERIPSLESSGRSGVLGRVFREFFHDSEFDGWIVVGSPMEHGAGGTQARDGHYAVQLGFALGQFVDLPRRFPVKLDVDVRAERLLGSNMIVVGGPRTNEVAGELNASLPIRFRQGGFWGSIVDETGRSYSSELDCVVAKVRNPWNQEKCCVLAAGMTGAGTKAAIIGICNYPELVFGDYAGGDFAALLRGVDRDGDGKVDSVELVTRR